MGLILKSYLVYFHFTPLGGFCNYGKNIKNDKTKDVFQKFVGWLHRQESVTNH